MIADPLVDRHESRRPHLSPGLLAPFSDLGVLTAADVHTATTVCNLTDEEPDGPVALAVALAVRAVRAGSVIVDLATVATTASGDEGADLTTLPWPEPTEWVDAVAASPATALHDDDDDVVAPLRLLGSTLALDRYWRHERHVAADLVERAQDTTTRVDQDLLSAGLDRVFPPGNEGEPDLQRVAAARAVGSRWTVVAGGPGTGKTTTVARILALMHEQAAAVGRTVRIALAAPTGKAAARLQEAVTTEAAGLLARGAIEASVHDAIVATPASTLHRLLGANPSTPTRFRHHRDNPLPHHVVVVDETSMVSLANMARLLDALRPTARLVLVGDPQQLTSVEAGAVLDDIVGPAVHGLRMTEPAADRLRVAAGVSFESDSTGATSVGNGVVVLHRNHRFQGAVQALADAVRDGDGDTTMAVLRGGTADVEFLDDDLSDPLGTQAAAVVEQVVARAATQARGVMVAAGEGRAADALAALAGTQILCAHRRGPFGVATWRRRVERVLADTESGFAWRGSFAGRPLLITRNDATLGLYNGDTGVVVETGDDKVLRAAFDRAGTPLLVSPARLSSVETLYAMTIHKAQGSQFDHPIVVLPDESSPILTRELLYTAITRARVSVTIAGTEAAVRAAVDRPVNRASGLRHRLWDGG